ncbi:MAG TPA: acyltransferase [Actinoplanes sp.]|nr:acyltransferase [Actinoplanes sp.]
MLIVDAPRPPRLAALDGLRLLAALAVALFHFSVGWRVDGVHPPAYFLPTAAHVSIYGFLGVELFFLISGFVICMSSWGRGLGEFFVSRVGRLYPAYWVCVLISAAVVLAFPLTGGVPVVPRPGLDDILINLTMLQQPMGVASIEGVYWTLFVELCFYLLFGIVVFFGVTYRRVVLFCAVWMTVAVFAPVLDSPLVNALAVPDFAPYFIAGIAMYLIRRFRPNPLLLGIVGFSWLVSMHRLGPRLATLDPGFAVPAWPGHLIVTAAFAVLLAVALGWTDRITWRWLTVAGALTYPFYLLHQRLGYLLIRAGYEDTELPVWALILAVTLALVGLSWVVHRYLERPLAAAVRVGMRRGLADLRDAERPPAPYRVPAPARRSATVAGADSVPEPARRPVRSGT